MKRTDLKLNEMLPLLTTDTKFKIIQCTKDRKNPVIYESGDYYVCDSVYETIQTFGERLINSFYVEDNVLIILLRRLEA